MKTAIALCTFYPNVQTLRCELALETIRFLSLAGYAVVVVDGSQDSEVGSALSEAGAYVYPQGKKGMGQGKREAARHALALSADIVLLMEPERPDLVRFVGAIVEPIVSGQADAVCVGRTQKSFATYPEFQRELETQTNEFYNGLVGSDFDAVFGPVALSRKAALGFAEFDPTAFGAEDTYIQVFYPVLLRKQGGRVTCVRVDFTYDPRQKIEEETTLSQEMMGRRAWQAKTVMDGVRAILLS